MKWRVWKTLLSCLSTMRRVFKVQETDILIFTAAIWRNLLFMLWSSLQLHFDFWKLSEELLSLFNFNHKTLCPFKSFLNVKRRFSWSLSRWELAKAASSASLHYFVSFYAAVKLQHNSYSSQFRINTKSSKISTPFIHEKLRVLPFRIPHVCFHFSSVCLQKSCSQMDIEWVILNVIYWILTKWKMKLKCEAK